MKMEIEVKAEKGGTVSKILEEKSVGIITAICPFVGYEKAAVLAKEAIKTGASIRDLILRDGLLTKEQLDVILNPYSMTEPGICGKPLFMKLPAIQNKA
ncbi:MAG TPA: hypothetical protein DEG06_00215, partial [Lachnospiraceae bacterium]|nr:hypothetical protein [Lachnospiraceae bacterium]